MFGRRRIPPNDRIPVLVWIYGGGFTAAPLPSPIYSGEKLAKKGVVLVSIAYRVGQLGFLAHPELSAESTHHVSGNYGLLDMIAGLQWIQKNIAAFGGDPRQGDHLRRIGRRHRRQHAVRVAPGQGTCSTARFPRAAARSAHRGPPPFPGENLKRLADAERAGESYAKSAGAAVDCGSAQTSRR